MSSSQAEFKYICRAQVLAHLTEKWARAWEIIFITSWLVLAEKRVVRVWTWNWTNWLHWCFKSLSVAFKLLNCNSWVNDRLLLSKNYSLNEPLTFFHKSIGKKWTIYSITIPSTYPITYTHTFFCYKICIFAWTFGVLRNIVSIPNKNKLLIIPLVRVMLRVSVRERNTDLRLRVDMI